MNTIISETNRNGLELNSLTTFIAGMRSTWGPLSSEVVTHSRALVEKLTQASVSETWLSSLLHEAPTYKELYRDPNHGFVLLGTVKTLGFIARPMTTAGGGSFMHCYRAKLRWDHIPASRALTAVFDW